MKRTKVVCTLGPASREENVLEALIAAGMDVARLNFSHGSHDDHRESYQRVRAVSERMGREVAILQDLQGPKIRVGKLPAEGVRLENGARVTFAPESLVADGELPTGYEALARDVQSGDAMLLDDGLLRLRIEQVRGDRVDCRVEVGGLLKSRKGMNLPGVAVSAPALTEKDLADLDFGVALGVDYLCLSFVRSGADVEGAKERLRAAGRVVPIIAKIEKPQAVERLCEILDVADGIMVARGDLGVELGPEHVPLVQKDAIEEANRRGKLVITATQMLESMVTSTFPTRAEASDVANAVLDQSDAVMLSAETATGAHPALVVQTMTRIIAEIERSARYRKLAELPPIDLGLPANALAHAAAAAAGSLPSVKAIVCISREGVAARLLSDYRPAKPILALTADREHCRRLAAFWGVHPLHFSEGAVRAEERIARADALLMERGLCARGDEVIVTLPFVEGADSGTNALTIHRVGG